MQESVVRWFFVDTWFRDGEVSVEELKKKLWKGETQWIDRIAHYSQRVRGSSAFWRAKRAEVYSWINYHVEAGNEAQIFLLLYLVLNTCGKMYAT
jgi:hypothetical protein